MKKKNKFKKAQMENANIKAALVKNKTLSLKRLLHDYEQIKNQVVPIPGVSALPLNDDMYEWHGNIKSLVEGVYKGAVLHFSFSFPRDYPLSPPKVRLLNPVFTHPNVLPDGSICLEMLEKNNSDKSWKSGYTILSILLELQSFFFDVDENFLTEENKKKIKDELVAMSEYNCTSCKHKGSSNPFPGFPEKNELNTKLTEDEYKKAKKDEICCYYIKESFEKVPIGLGVNIFKNSRTAQINSIVPCFDFVSLKAFSRERLRVSFDGNRFSHWFPLYFGEEEKKDKFLNTATKAISMIANGNTKEFSPDLILKVMTKYFGSCIINIVTEKVHNSSRALEILIYIYRILILFAKSFPEFKEEVNKKVENFINDPEQRIKEKTPSLSDLLIMLSVSDHKIEELLPSLISEQMDRQILWILMELPELEDLINSSEIDDIRAKVCFKAAILGQQVTLFYYYLLNKIVYSECKTLDEFAEKLDKNYGCLTESEIDKHRAEIKNLLKIDNFNDFYKFLNLKTPSKEELNQLIKQAFENSKKKKYHGVDEVRFVPSPEKQIEYYMKKYENFDNLLENGKLLDKENPKWKELCLNTFDIVKQYRYTYAKKEFTPLDIIRFYREKMSEKLFFKIRNNNQEIAESNNNFVIGRGGFRGFGGRGRGGFRPRRRRGDLPGRGRGDFRGRGRGDLPGRGRGDFRGRGRGGLPDRGGRRRNRVFRGGRTRGVFGVFDSNNNTIKKMNSEIEEKINKRKFKKKIEDEEIIEKFTWRQLYLKLYFEEYCKYFRYIADFKQLYNIADNIKDEITHFSLVISDYGILRSDFNYIRGVLSKLTSLKYLELIFTSNTSAKLLKNIEKGISNALKEGATIEHLKVIENPNIYRYSTKELNILTILDKLPHLKVLDVTGLTLDFNLIQRIKNHLYFYKKIKVLDLSYCNIDDNMCNELSDGIMKAKCLEKLYIPDNKMVKGLSSIIYNLAFQPSIKVLDASYNKTCDLKETAVSLNKLIKMSQTIETIIINNIPGLNMQLTNDFYNALGDNNNLLYLDLSKNGSFNDIYQLGHAIAFNALKNGSLEYLDISSCLSDYTNFMNFIKSMQISENDHMSWYGFQFNGNIAKDSPQYFEKVFHCKLKTLNIKDCRLQSYINYLAPLEEQKENGMKILLNNNNLDTLIFDNSQVNSNFIKSISESIKSPNNLQYLSLSNCDMKGEIFQYFLPCFYEAKDKSINLEKKMKIKKSKNRFVMDGDKVTENPNFHIKGLDLSCNNFGYSSIFSLCQALKMNKTLEYLNLFHNCIDVSGAGQVGEVLKVNNNLIELDIGYNRIKNNGFKKVINGIKENQTSKLKKLGVKYNFIKDKVLEEQFDVIENTDTISLEEIELKNNSFTSRFLTSFYQDKYKKMKKNIKTDVFYILYSLEPERLERTVWLDKGVNDTENEIYQTILGLEKNSDCIGIPLAIKKLRGRKTGAKKDNCENNAFVEFIMPNSVNKMLKIGKSNQFYLSGKKRNIYKAGTRLDYLVVKQKKMK